MKKKFYFIILLLTMFMPYIVKADMGAPSIRRYEATVINSAGVDYYVYDTYDEVNNKSIYKKAGHLNSGDKFTVSYEGNNDNDKFIEIVLDESFDQKYIFDLDSVKPVDLEIDPTKIDLGDDVVFFDSEKIALTNADVDLLKGPSFAYDKITTIPKGTNLSYKYGIGSEGLTYIYVEYEGNKGWISILDEKVLIEANTRFVTFIDTKSDCGIIEAGTIFTSKYKTDSWSSKYTYDKGYCNSLLLVFKSESIAEMDRVNTTYMSNLNIDLYDKVGNKGKKVYTLKAGELFTPRAILFAYEDNKEYVYLYFENEIFTGFAYVNYDDLTYVENSKASEIKEYTKREEKKEETVPKEEESKESEEYLEIETEDIKEDKNRVIICVIVGLSLAVIATCTILVINKKKKENKGNDTTKKNESEVINNEETIEESLEVVHDEIETISEEVAPDIFGVSSVDVNENKDA